MIMSYPTQFQKKIRLIPTLFKLTTVISLFCVIGWLGVVQHVQAQSIKDSRASLKIETNKMQFKGDLLWTIDDGEVKPVLAGELDLKDAGGLCGRMRMDFFAEGHVLLTTKYGGENPCPKSDSRQRWTVSMDPFDSNKLHEVKVSIEKKTASKDWTIIGSETVKLEAITHKVKITEENFDFGGDSFVLGAPTNSGVVGWSWSAGKITPHVSGYIHINNAASACARLQIKYFSIDGDLLETKYGGKVCASDNAHWYRHIDLSKYSDWKIASIKINLQSLRADGTWRTVGGSSSRYVTSNSSGCPDGGVCTTRLTGG